ncbi:hypothetical protein [Desulfatitalea alkaliphila]|uniref:Uncharacterized protein n=1 Tax=Desulfatitalea alkaliphila TaxID=2929485 RepID=A0AA41R2P8_9BACT|nr:hypothetical protein [Desulfatitalea alkaliphila]MCJ8501024.1 hypothetical protein [Desulfatitalea alkaliphila]
MAHSLGKASWNFGPPESKQSLTAEQVDQKAHEISKRYADVLLNLGVACTQLAAAGDVLGLQCISVATKALLADAVTQCAAAMGVVDEILE